MPRIHNVRAACELTSGPLVCSDRAIWLVDHLDLTFLGSGLGRQELGTGKLLLVNAAHLLRGNGRSLDRIVEAREGLGVGDILRVSCKHAHDTVT